MLMSFFGETNPRRTQQRFLQELGRILKPDGQLFVAIENRWNYEYFGGRPDHHSGLKYGSLLPRFLANSIRSHVAGDPIGPIRTASGSFDACSRMQASPTRSVWA